MLLRCVFFALALLAVSALIEDADWIDFHGDDTDLSEATVFHGVDGHVALIGEGANKTYGHAFFSPTDEFCARYVTNDGNAGLECERFKVLRGDNYVLMEPNAVVNIDRSNITKVAALIFADHSDGIFFGWADMKRSVAGGITRGGIVFRVLGRRAVAKRSRLVVKSAKTTSNVPGF